jgi:hypothetical protein
MRPTDTPAPMAVTVPAVLMFTEPVLSIGYILVSWVVKPFRSAPWALLILALMFAGIWVGVGVMLLRRQRWARNTALVLAAFGVLGALQNFKVFGVLSVIQLAIFLGIFIPLITKRSSEFFAKTPLVAK